jgi:phasin family protein
MAESPDNAVKSAEEAYAATAAQPAKSEIAKAEAAPGTPDQSVASTASATAAPEAVKIIKPAAKKPASAKSRVISGPRRVPAAKAQPAPAGTEVPTLSELKDKIMATAKTTTDFTKPFADAIGDIQTKAKAAYDKSVEFAAEATEFAKGNVEALVESSKVYAAGVQDLSKGYVEEAKSAYETLTADVRELAAVKSPLELFQLQSKLARRNFDAWVAYGSKNADAVIKLASESFAPISGRISLAVEKIAKAA